MTDGKNKKQNKNKNLTLEKQQFDPGSYILLFTFTFVNQNLDKL